MRFYPCAEFRKPFAEHPPDACPWVNGEERREEHEMGSALQGRGSGWGQSGRCLSRSLPSSSLD